MKKIHVFLYTAFVVTMSFVTTFAGPVYALPSLQLGPGSTGTWSYDNGTWIVNEGSFDFNAYANALKSQGGDGHYAWGKHPENNLREAYLVISAVPKMSNDTDVFDVTVMNDGGDLARFGWGYGNPPTTDSNDLPPHGIFDTYFEIYQFNFDGEIGTIYNTQPGDAGSGQGYTEPFDINIVSLSDGVTGVHFDLFTMCSDGKVLANAPFSHDAEHRRVPEPSTMILLGMGLICMVGLVGRKKFKRN